MDYSNIRALLDKYWEGETSLEEEARLKQFFATAPEGLPQDLQEAAPLFQYFDLATPQFELPAAAALQAHLEKAPAETPVIRMGFLRNWMQYAAMLAIALGIGYGIQRHMDAGEDAGAPPATVASTTLGQTEIKDPQEAYAETKKALLLLSKNLNKGKQEMAKLNVINEATDKVKAN
jgi:hypothetical protein